MADTCRAIQKDGRKCPHSTRSKKAKDGKCGTHAKKVWASPLEEQLHYRSHVFNSFTHLFWRADIAFMDRALNIEEANETNEDPAILDALLAIQAEARAQHDVREAEFQRMNPPVAPLAPRAAPLVAPPAPRAAPLAPVGAAAHLVAPAAPRAAPLAFEEEFFGENLGAFDAFLQAAAAARAAPLVPAPPPIPQVFTADSQNIHRASVVAYVTDMMDRLATIPVPPKQKTVGEILVALDLSDRAALKLTDMYYHADSIYEIDGAYKKALDPVWAYIKGHAERAELELRLQQELEDNIGMCAQGNLSRLINAVSGYLDGVAPPVSVGERLQNGFAAIAGKSMSTLKKIQEGKELLKELNVPKDEWDTWLEAF